MTFFFSFFISSKLEKNLLIRVLNVLTVSSSSYPYFLKYINDTFTNTIKLSVKYKIYLLQDFKLKSKGPCIIELPNNNDYKNITKMATEN